MTLVVTEMGTTFHIRLNLSSRTGVRQIHKTLCEKDCGWDTTLTLTELMDKGPRCCGACVKIARQNDYPGSEVLSGNP